MLCIDITDACLFDAMLLGSGPFPAAQRAFPERPYPRHVVPVMKMQRESKRTLVCSIILILCVFILFRLGLYNCWLSEVWLVINLERFLLIIILLTFFQNS